MDSYMDNLVRSFSQINKTLAGVIEANRGQGTGLYGMYNDAHFLSIKLLNHAVSMNKIFQSTDLIELDGLSLSFCDYSSIIALARSSIETYLVFFWLFISPKSISERNLTYLSWRLTGSNLRLKFSSLKDENDPVMAAEKTHNQELMRKIKRSAEWKRMSAGKRDSYLKRLKQNHGVRPQWNDLIVASELSNGFKYTYKFFCEHAHSGRTAVCQIYTSHNDIVAQRQMCGLPLKMVRFVIACLIIDYSKLFKPSAKWLSANEEHYQRALLHSDLAKIGLG
ncbi:DUF5677 domain-containing protein [Pseudodesulfovibrio sediminis]|uniref:DUF5677 domain-containing protein n=1 Tax=Pseudodesulfovibrio sediminis TaxID=2810563 RepID=UPI001E2E37DE|nr:DUF5677 domain-containing protein [Pseudodesulfovibrio sediminis]